MHHPDIVLAQLRRFPTPDSISTRGDSMAPLDRMVSRRTPAR